MRKYDTEYQCLDEHCRTVVVGNGKYMDGIRCPRCDGPVVPQPFRKHKKVSEDAWYVRKQIIEQKLEHCRSLTPDQVDTVLDIYKEKQKNTKFNVNQTVKVKLTEAGINILKEQRNQLNKHVQSRGGKGLGEYVLKTDDGGYTSFQLWHLMETFGPYMGMVMPLLFETDIILVDET